jgi:hypothetical protein
MAGDDDGCFESTEGIEAMIADVRADAVIAEVATEFGVTVDEILSRGRATSIAAVRHVAIRRVAAALPDLSCPRLGLIFGRDHTTIIYALGRLGRPSRPSIDRRSAPRRRAPVSIVALDGRFEAGPRAALVEALVEAYPLPVSAADVDVIAAGITVRSRWIAVLERALFALGWGLVREADGGLRLVSAERAS